MHVGVGIGCLAALLWRVISVERATVQQLYHIKRGAFGDEKQE